jgi:hypothetical protein
VRVKLRYGCTYLTQISVTVNETKVAAAVRFSLTWPLIKAVDLKDVGPYAIPKATSSVPESTLNLSD